MYNGTQVMTEWTCELKCQRKNNIRFIKVHVFKENVIPIIDLKTTLSEKKLLTVNNAEQINDIEVGALSCKEIIQSY